MLSQTTAGVESSNVNKDRKNHTAIPKKPTPILLPNQG